MRTAAPLAALASLALSAGCSSGPFNAPYNASISVDLDTIYVANSSSFWYADGIGAALKMHVLVTAPDKTSGEPVPLNNVWVEVIGPTAGVYLLPEEAVQTIARPSSPFPDASAAEIRDMCTDDNGNVLNSGDNEWCGWYFDESAAGFVQLAPSYSDAAGYTEDGQAFGPNYLRTGTNNFGRVDMWLFIDALPVSGTPPTDARRRSNHDVGLDTGHAGDTGPGAGGGDDGGGADFEMGDALITASIGHDTTTVILTADQ
jgi:hypothetical protein